MNELLNKALTRLNIPVDVVKRVYCNGESVSDKSIVKKLLLLESILADEGVKNINQLIINELCRSTEVEEVEKKVELKSTQDIVKEEKTREEIEEELHEEEVSEEVGLEEVEKEVEDVGQGVKQVDENVDKSFTQGELIVEIPIMISEGRTHVLRIWRGNGKYMTNLDMCREVEDFILGSLNVYLKCGNEWKTFLHTLPNNVFGRVVEKWDSVSNVLRSFVKDLQSP